MKRSVLVLTLSLTSLLAAAVAVDPWSGRERHRAVVNPAVRVDDGRVLQLRGEWDFAKSNANSPGMFLKPWSHGQGKVKVPGCWEASGVGEPGVPPTYRCQDNSPKPLRHVWMGTGVYERTVKLPPAWTNAGQRVWLAAGGIAAQGWISVNDRWAGNDSPVGHYDSYCGTYRWDITDLLRGGDEARIRVLADNTVPCRGGGLYSSIRFGGIYRDIELQLTGDCWIEDAFVRCADGTRPVPEPHVELGGNTNGVKVALSYSSETFDWWSPERPNLYTCRIEVTRGGKLLDRRVERFGLKRLEHRGKEFYLNGRPFFFRGFGDNHPYPVTGAPPADRAFHRAHLAKAKAAGFNYVRLHTHTEVPEYFEAADELGILVQPELPYYGNYGEDPFEFDPLRDAAERRDHCRRHVSYAIASGGNEGMFCDATAKALYRLQKETDPDRLVVEQDGCWPTENDAEGRSDYISGPLVPWKRGAFNQTPFICHEYLNLTVKSDSRDEAKYADTLWQPLLTREKRAAWLAKFGLGHDWGDRFQDSAHALQRMYQKMGLEWARMDPYCDGYCFWTIADTVVMNEKAGVFTAQGWLDPFWDVKRGAWTPEEFAVFNSPSAILLDLTDNPAAFPADQWDADAWWKEGGLRPRPKYGCIFEDTNRVFTAGGKIDARFILAAYAERDLDAAALVWKLEGPSGVLARGEKALGHVTAGPPRTVLETKIPLPEVTRPVKARITATLTGAPANAWDVWVFPKRMKRDGSRVFAVGRVRAALAGGFDNLRETAAAAKVVVGLAGSDELKAAAARGCDTVEFHNLDTPANFKLGWWWLGRQTGTAIAKHPALGDFPCGPTLDALFFRIIKEGAPLPFAGVASGDLVIAGEGVDACYLYLAVAKHPSGARRIVVAGLDLLADRPEAAYLLDALVGYLLKDAAVESDGSTVLSGVSTVPPLISAAGVASAGTASSGDCLELTWRNESAVPAAPRLDLPFRATRVHLRQADGSWRHVPYTNDAQGAAVLLTEIPGGAEAVFRVGMYANEDWQICPKSRTPPWPVECPCCRTVAENAALRRHYEAVKALDARADAVWDGVRTTHDVARLRDRLRADFIAAIGGFPERTPLDARVTGVVRREGYRVEKVVFASQPGHFVTAHVFVPDGVTSANPAPAVLVSCGHAENGKLYRLYQRAAVLAARAGLIGMVFDPLEQGERWQGPKDSLCGPCNGHFRTGKRAHLLGWNAARFRIWDGMRSVDYLQSRPDVDGARLGVMGQSGGGTLSTYLFCLDDRLICAAPAGFITSMTRLAEHWGPQDSEQVLQGQLVFGLNHLSMLAVRAPAPVCLTLVDQDAFVLDGSLATAAKLKALYARLGAPERTAIVREPGIHSYYEGTLRGSVDWMRRHLKGETGACDYGREDDFGLSGDPEAYVTPGGRVVDLPGSRTSYDLLRDELKRRDLARGDRAFTREDVLRLTGIDPDVETAADDDCSVNFGRKAYFSRFQTPLAETAAVDIWLGTSFVKERAELFIVRAKNWCRRHPGLKMSLSVGADEAVAAAHARYLRPDLIGQVSYAARPPSWRSLFEEDVTDPPVASLVFGALPTYDWTDLLR